MNKVLDELIVEDQGDYYDKWAVDNIMSVRLGMTVESEVLALFGRYCPRLKSIDYDFTNQNDLQFLRIYGHKLEEQYFSDFSDKDCLKLCPNLKSIRYFTSVG